MPYPIAQLAYGLRCRLGELATRFERYDLQIAAGGASICPPKLQIVRESLKSLTFGCKNKTVSAYRNYNVLNVPVKVSQDDSITICNGPVILYTLDAQSLKSAVFDHFLFKTDSLQLKLYCLPSKPFYETLKMIFPKVQHLEMSCFTQDYPLVFTDVLTAFPKLGSIVAKEGPLSENWISEILQIKNHSLMSLTTDINAFLGTLDFDKFLTFVKAQRPGFELTVFADVSSEWFERNLPGFLPFLDKNLVRLRRPLQEKIYTVVYIFPEFGWYLPNGLKASKTTF